MAIKEYSMSRDSTRQLSPNFKVREFACKGSDVVLLDDELVVLLQCIREHFGKPVHITSGYRTAAHNAAVGGSKSSQHLLGRAADFHVEGVDVATVAAYAETLLPSRGGIGRYPKDAAHPKRRTGWVHIDTRAGKSRWKM
ncbi:MAG: YcbK family protein [Faecalibacterium prausnitzii]